MICLYGSQAGTTRRLARRMAPMLGGQAVDVLDIRSAVDIAAYRHFVLLSPTYGDEEFEMSFESFLTRIQWAMLSGRSFAFCEVGIYTGYETFGHGLIPRLRHVLAPAGLVEIAAPLSLDAVPIRDWSLVEQWAASIVAKVEEAHGRP